MQAGQGPGLSLRDLGETAGEQTVTLLQTEMPAHSHTMQEDSSNGGTVNDPGNNTWADLGRGRPGAYNPSVPASNVQMHPFGLSIAGGSQPHNNMQPFLGLTFIIALQGVFPARS